MELYNNIPSVMRELPQWTATMADSNGKFKRPACATGAASPTSINTWHTFNDAVALANNPNNPFAPVPIGFMLSAADDFTCIDIDTGFAEDDIDAQPDPVAARIKFDFHRRLLMWLNKDTQTYTERSISGYNHHVWVRGNIGSGIRLQSLTINHQGAPYVLDNAGIEIYSQDRFMTVTGDIVGSCNVINAINIDSLLAQSTKRVALQVLTDIPPTVESQVVINQLLTHAHYQALWSHQPMPLRWSSYPHALRDLYPSQSEADYTLIIAIAKLTDSNSQVREIFCMSGLGKRDKAQSATLGYIDRSLSRARATIAIERQQSVEIDTLVSNLIARHNTGLPLAQTSPTMQTATAAQLPPAVPPLPVMLVPMPTAIGNDGLSSQAASRTMPKPKVTTKPRGEGNFPQLVSTRKRYVINVPDLDVTDIIGDWNLLDIGIDDELDYPPGLAGLYGRWIYGYSPQPMVEACIVHTLSVLSGIAGNCYKVNPHYPTGININAILMSLSGTGKDILHSGMGHLRKALADTAPEFHEFIDHSRYKSEAALSQAVGVAKYDSILHLMPEFSKELHAANSGNQQSTEIFNWMLTAYSYSTVGNIVAATRKSGFATGKAGTETRQRPDGFSYSMVGECTEGDLNKALSSGMLRDGRLSRFLCVRGDSFLQINDVDMQELPPMLKRNITAMITRQMQGGYQLVHMTPDAERLINKYHHVIVAQLNQLRDEEDSPERASFTRARLKAWRIAGSLAVLENPVTPVITLEQICWAIGIVNRDIKILSYKITNRIVGDSADDHDRMAKIKSFIETWIGMGRYNLAEHTRLFGDGLRYGIIPLRVIREQVKQLTMFKDDRTGKSDVKLITTAINHLVNEGTLRVISEEAVVTQYNLTGFKGVIYQINS